MSFWGPFEAVRPILAFFESEEPPRTHSRYGSAAHRPQCFGQCQPGSDMLRIQATLMAQQNQSAVLRWEMERRRLASLTPDKMRTALASLGARIEAARR